MSRYDCELAHHSQSNRILSRSGRHDQVDCVPCDLVIWLLTYLVDAIPLPEPFHRVAPIAILVIGVLIVILLLLQFVGAIDDGVPRLAR